MALATAVGSLSMTNLPQQIADDLDRNFAQVVYTYQDSLYSGVRRLSPSPGDAEDITQDAFVRAYRALGTYDRERILSLDLRAWLWTIALNLSRNAARSRSRRLRTVVLTPGDDPPARNQPDDSLAMMSGQIWDERLAKLTSPQRTAVVLRFVADLSYTQIATATNRPEGSVKSDVHRGLKHLRTILEEEGPS